jgi:glycosyltransferase involved in cell wall biosynthesis
MKTNKRPSIAIVTSVLNARSGLIHTANSIRSQTAEDFQWIIIDGGSSDHSQDVFSQYSDVVTDWISEPDKGIYDAWNKAINLIRSEWTIFLGAGDVFATADTLERAQNALIDIDDRTSLVYGNVAQINPTTGTEMYRYGKVDVSKWEIYRPKLPAHQGVFQRTRLLLEFKFDTNYRVISDSKFMLLASRTGMLHYLGFDICYMEPGGISSNPRYAKLVMKEFLRLEKESGYRIPPLLRMTYIAKSYIKEFLFRAIKR